VNVLRFVWYLTALEKSRELIRQHDLFSSVLQTILVDFSKSNFDQEFREICIATLSNFTSADNVRLLVHNSFNKLDFYRELVRVFGFADSENI